METRLARDTDLGPIVAIYNQAVEEQAVADLQALVPSERRDWLRSHDPDRHPILVADAGGEVVGWASVSPYRPGRGALSRTAEISYFVDRGRRRGGVASTLVGELMALCPGLGIDTLFAIVLDDNAGSLALLTRFGFARWGHLPRVARFVDREVGHLYLGIRLA